MLRDQVEILLARVTAPHRRSTRVDPDCTGRWRCLQTLRQVADRLDQAGAGVARMRAREADALDARHVVDLRQQLREVARQDRPGAW